MNQENVKIGTSEMTSGLPRVMHGPASPKHYLLYLRVNDSQDKLQFLRFGEVLPCNSLFISAYSSMYQAYFILEDLFPRDIH